MIIDISLIVVVIIIFYVFNNFGIIFLLVNLTDFEHWDDIVFLNQLVIIFGFIFNKFFILQRILEQRISFVPLNFVDAVPLLLYGIALWDYILCCKLKFWASILFLSQRIVILGLIAILGIYLNVLLNFTLKI